MKTTKLALAALLLAAPAAVFANDHGDHGATEAELATPSLVPTEAAAEAVSGTMVEATDATNDAAHHDHGTMKKDADGDHSDAAAPLKKTAH